MTWSIYLLSILDGVGNFLCFISGFSFILSTIAYTILICIAATIKKCGTEYALGDDDRSVLEFCETHFGVLKKVALIAAPVWFLSFLIPSRTDFLESYMMVEGSKIANVETSKEAADAVLKRIDRLIGAIEKATK